VFNSKDPEDAKIIKVNIYKNEFWI
jgi:hypothetical protein